MMGPGGGMWGPMRSFRRDPSVTKRKLPAGTLRRIAAFARPYRRAIVTLVSLLALDAAIGHARTRTQFGAPIGSFQSPRHALADEPLAQLLE